jgi:hypothetical protein
MHILQIPAAYERVFLYQNESGETNGSTDFSKLPVPINEFIRENIQFLFNPYTCSFKNMINTV